MNKAFKPYSKTRFYRKLRSVRTARALQYSQLAVITSLSKHRLDTIKHTSVGGDDMHSKINKQKAIVDLMVSTAEAVSDTLKPKSRLRVKKVR